MKLFVYIKIGDNGCHVNPFENTTPDKQHFNAKAFDDTLPEELKGEVYTTWRVIDGKKVPRSINWKSHEVHVEPIGGESENELYDLVSKYSSALSRIKDDPNIIVSAEIVQCSNSGSEICGLYLESRLMKLLSGLNINLDIDINC